MVGPAALGVALAIVMGLSAPAAAQIYDCRRYPPSDVMASLKTQAEAMRKIELEAADRIKGLDTRPYEWLLEQTRAAEKAIAVPALLKAEDALLERCRNAIKPVRRVCAAAAAALTDVIGELAVGAPGKASKQLYLQTMSQCERWLSLAPLQTALRPPD